MLLRIKIVSLLIVCALVSPLPAGLIYDENVDAPGGVFSRNPNAPTPIPTLTVGINSISGIIEDIFGPAGNSDIYTITIPAGHELIGIYQQRYVSSDEFAFFAMDIGPTFPFATLDVTSDLSQFIGGSLIGPDVEFLPPPAPPGTRRNLLTVVGSGANGTQIGTFSVLPSGVYTVYAQQTADYTEYTLGFEVAATGIPEPSSLLLTAGAAFLGLRRRRR